MDVLSYRPGTKMLAFLLTTSLFTGAVLWDKAEAKRITSEAKTQVRELGQQKIRVDDMPRTVKGTKMDVWKLSLSNG